MLPASTGPLECRRGTQVAATYSWQLAAAECLNHANPHMMTSRHRQSSVLLASCTVFINEGLVIRLEDVLLASCTVFINEGLVIRLEDVLLASCTVFINEGLVIRLEDVLLASCTVFINEGLVIRLEDGAWSNMTPGTCFEGDGNLHSTCTLLPGCSWKMASQ
jgi:uncharacterized protein YjeT (DUF2065 family)